MPARERGNWDGGARVASEVEPPAGANTGRNNKKSGLLTVDGRQHPPRLPGWGMASAAGQETQVWQRAHNSMWGGGGVKGGKQRPPLAVEAGTAEVGEADPPERQEKRKGARASQQGRSNGRSVGARRLAQHSGRR